MNDEEQDLAALKREWLAARVVLVAGFALVLGYGIYVAAEWRASVQHARQQAAAEVATQQAAVAQNEAAADAGAQLCKRALVTSQGFGIVPGYAKLTATEPQKTSVTGRYACPAATDSSNFILAVDLVCRDLANPHCTSLYSVTQNGNAVLYRRRD